MGVKYWWFYHDSGIDEVYICRSDQKKTSDNEDYRLKQKDTDALVAPIAEITEYTKSNKRKDTIKVKFQDKDDPPRTFELNYFQWNKTELSKMFIEEMSDRPQFVSKFNNILKAGASVIDVYDYQSRSSGSTSSSTLDEPPIMTSTPKTSTNRQPPKRRLPSEFNSEDLPPLIKKSNGVDSVEGGIVEEIKKAHLGFSSILIQNLESSSSQVRDCKQYFVNILVAEMESHSNSTYQPYTVLTTQTLSKKEQWKAENANGYKYEVIGGQHNLAACKIMQVRHPNKELFASRYCEIYYGEELSVEAKTYLGVRSNKIGEKRRPTTTKEKVELCRSLFLASNGDKEKFEELCAVMLDEASKKDRDVMVAMARRRPNTFQKFKTVLEMYEKGQLLGQKAKFTDSSAGLNMRLYIFRPMNGLGMDRAGEETVVLVLSNIIDRTIAVQDIASTTKSTKLLLDIQAAIMSILGVCTWQEVVVLYPALTKRDDLISQFKDVKFEKTKDTVPSEIVAWCQDAEKASNQQASASKIVCDSIACHIIEVDAVHLSSTLISSIMDGHEKAPAIQLTVIDMPQDWSNSDLSAVLGFVASHNLTWLLPKWTVAVLCGTGDVSRVVDMITKTEQYEHVAPCFYHISNTRPDVLGNTMYGMVLGHRTKPLGFTWQNKTNGNFVSVGCDSLWRDEDGNPVDKDQKPVAIYNELIVACTHPNQWVMDICCGTGTGATAAMLNQRNCVAVDTNMHMLNHLKGRINVEKNKQTKLKASTKKAQRETEESVDETDGENEPQSEPESDYNVYNSDEENMEVEKSEHAEEEDTACEKHTGEIASDELN